jgi:hypothetical protein
MDLGEGLTRWTIRAALALYVLTLAVLLTDRAGQRGSLARLSWTAACVAYWAHVGCAFEFFHDWSHAAAYRETARQTQELFGWDWGGGLYFNYAFTLLWTADMLWWWLAPGSRRNRPHWMSAALHLFLGFIAFNATVVFESGALRWLALVTCAALATLAWRR